MKGYSNGKMYEVAITDIAVGNVQARKYFDEQGLKLSAKTEDTCSTENATKRAQRS